ncbi:hypothetical protein H8S95_15460 [Pontibacter sp. KCTC 32443]|uniref:hypothetical protein n=1 Tax=Pontibacter TaxID=323449 RepID=UPI00164E15A5|nr:MULTISPECIES: hypothetical protein [Pontibacter]MBC5775474.1 hypothetical protein [Pontibacter sp. KCTC 32443]
MKTILYKTLALVCITFLSTSCDQEIEAEVKPMTAMSTKKFGTVPGTTIINFSETTGYLNEVKVMKDSYTTLPVKITATRFQNGQPVAGNAALVYDTTKPDKKNNGYTAVNRGPFQLGNILTVGQSQGANTTINDKGGVIEMDFSSFGSVVMRGLYIADIEENERGSTLELLDASGSVIYVTELPVTGAYTFQPMILAGQGVANVAKLRVTFKSTNGKGGSGAIDVIQFCPGSVCYR